MDTKALQNDLKNWSRFVQLQWKPVLIKSFHFFKKNALRFGFRVSKLSSNKVELIVPLKWNTDENGKMMLGPLTQAACEAVRIGLSWSIPGLRFQDQDLQCHFETNKMNSDIKVRFLISDLDKEILISELDQNSNSVSKFQILYFTAADIKVGHVELSCRIDHRAKLGSTQN